MCLVFGSIVAMPAASFAAENSDIKVTAELSSENDGQATVGDTLTFKGTWDATDANPQPGDQFTVTLPAELGFKGNVPFDLRGSDGTTVWGSCQT
ncbi:MAG: Ig-like domain-containing protein, partial [Ancrocorticia sp.]|nr:Ig-like domain-containing protein [Ancrocorticia sp.]